MANYLETTTHNISWFKKIHDQDELQMSPPFQRNLVWTEKQKSFLIDSVLRGYPIPEIYLQEKISADGTPLYIVVDGQQRINSVLEFIEGKFPIDDGESTTWANMYFDDLVDQDKKNFYSYKFVIRVLPEISEEEIRSIFQRINKNNIALNQQELRQSTYSGDFINSMNLIADRGYWKELGLFSPSKVRRMQDVEYISEIVVAFLNGHQNKKDKLDYFYKLYETDYSERDKVEELFDKICTEILKLIPNIKKTRWNNIVDFYTLFLAFASIERKLPLSSSAFNALSDTLETFGEEVTNFQKIKDPSQATSVNANVIQYANGIRNSSDLRSRKDRFDALLKEIGKVIK